MIPLSRWRAVLARARTGRRADALISEPDAASLVPTLPVQELYFAIKEAGLADAEGLVALASAEQIQGMLDLDAWDKDGGFSPERMQPWVEALLDAGPDKLARGIEGLDPELVALYLQKQACVYDLTLEPVPERPAGHFFPTPDGFYLVDVLSPGERGKSLERMLDWLYRADMDLARRVVMSAKWELASDLEEYSARWRAGRMADLGFPERDEALALYRFLDPRSVRIGEGTQEGGGLAAGTPTTLPAPMGRTLDTASLTARALATISEAALLDRLQASLITLTNQVAVAEGADPAAPDTAAVALGRTMGFVDLGLEYLSRGDVARAGEALRTVALSRILRVGVSLTLQLRQLADTLWARGRILLGSGVLLDEPYAAVVRALRARPLPRFAGELDAPPRPLSTRAFKALEDVSVVAEVLREAAEAPALVWDALRVPADALEDPEVAAATPPGGLRLGTIVRTLAARILVTGRPPPGFRPVPLDPAELEALTPHMDELGLLPEARRLVEEALLRRAGGRADVPVLLRWLDRWLEELGPASVGGEGLLWTPLPRRRPKGRLNLRQRRPRG